MTHRSDTQRYSTIPVLLLAVVIAHVLLLLLAVVCPSAEARPTQLHLAFTGVPSEMSVMFVDHRDERGVPYVVEYWIDEGNKQQTNRTVRPAFGKPYSVHDHNKGGIVVYQRSVYEVLMVDLPVNTRIAYRVGDSKRDEWSDTHRFVTAQGPAGNLRNGAVAAGIQYPFTFLSYGDMDTTFASMETQQHLRDVLSKDDTIRFIVHQGDIPYAWSEDKWDTWFDMMQDITARFPYMVCPGNHESDFNFTTYKHRFTNITGFSSMGAERLNRHSANLFYSWDYANIHFVALSSEHAYDPGSLQYRWLEADLKRVDRRRTPFVIVYIHRPMYSSNKNHGSNIKLRNAVEPLYKRYGVDLALFGHVHAYERTCEVFDGKCVRNASGIVGNDTIVDPQATIQIHAGTAGYELNRDWEDKPAWSTYRESSHGFLKLTMKDRQTLEVQYLRNPSYRKDGQVVGDSFTITKTQK